MTEDVSMIENENQAVPTKPSQLFANVCIQPEEEKKQPVNSRSRKEEGPVETPEEIKEIDMEYVKRLGEGTYGVVYLAKNNTTEEEVAIKEIKIDHCDDGIPSTAIREIAVLQELQDAPYIVTLKKIIHGSNTNNRLFLSFEYFN
jgi:serine/threonine protein kinase